MLRTYIAEATNPDCVKAVNARVVVILAPNDDRTAIVRRKVKTNIPMAFTKPFIGFEAFFSCSMLPH